MSESARLLGYLEHILQAIERIQCYTGDIDRRYPEFATSHPELPLVSAYEMRNVL